MVRSHQKDRSNKIGQFFDDKFWSGYFKVYDCLIFLIPYQELVKNIIDCLDTHKDDIVLDVGSGTGNIAVLLNEKVQKIICLDNSKAGINIHLTKDHGAGVVLHDLINSLPFDDNFFSKIYSNNTLYLISPQYRLQIMKELHRILKPGGKIVLNNLLLGFKPHKIYFDHIKRSVHDKGIIFTIRQLCLFVLPTIKIFYYNYLIKKNNVFGEYKFMEIEEQQGLLKQAGFICVSDNMITYGGQAVLNTAYKGKNK